MSAAPVDDPELRRLRWQCRRGLLELDVLLGRFLGERYPALPAADRSAFQSLLELPDNEILAWIEGRAEPHDDLKNIIRLIR